MIGTISLEWKPGRLFIKLPKLTQRRIKAGYNSRRDVEAYIAIILGPVIQHWFLPVNPRPAFIQVNTIFSRITKKLRPASFKRGNCAMKQLPFREFSAKFRQFLRAKKVSRSSEPAEKRMNFWNIPWRSHQHRTVQFWPSFPSQLYHVTIITIRVRMYKSPEPGERKTAKIVVIQSGQLNSRQARISLENWRWFLPRLVKTQFMPSNKQKK